MRVLRYEGTRLEPGRNFNVVKDTTFDGSIPKVIEGGAQLSHEEEPWQVSFNGLNGNAAAVIPSELIQSYYVHLLTASAADQQYHHVPRFDHPKNIYVNRADFDWLVSYLDEG